MIDLLPDPKNKLKTKKVISLMTRSALNVRKNKNIKHYQEILPLENFLQEYCTVTINLGRGQQHRIAVMELIKENDFYICYYESFFNNFRLNFCPDKTFNYVSCDEVIKAYNNNSKYLKAYKPKIIWVENYGNKNKSYKFYKGLINMFGINKNGHNPLIVFFG